MDISLILTLALVVATATCLILGYPVAFTLAGVSIIFLLIGDLVGVAQFSILGAIPSRIFGSAISNYVLLAIPMFVFMGVVLEKSRVAENLLNNIGELFGTVRGGIGIGVTVVGMLLAASTGVVGATVVTMGLLALPTMLKNRYDPQLACGSICAAGTLGQIIPPSIVLIILTDQMSIAYVKAQRKLGNFTPEPVSVGDMFVAALVPGLILVGLYILYQIGIAIFQPSRSPAAMQQRQVSLLSSLPKLAAALLPPLLLIILVLGSILVGLATPTEAAAVGSVGALILAAVNLFKYGEKIASTTSMVEVVLEKIFLYRFYSPKLAYYAGASLLLLLVIAGNFDLRMNREVIETSNLIMISLAILLVVFLLWVLLLSCWRLYRHQILFECCFSAAKVTIMIFAILIGAAFFSLAFRGLGGDQYIEHLLLNLPGGFYTQLAVVMVVIFLLGFIIDFIEISLIVVPIVAPLLLLNDISPLWLGVLIAMNLQTSFLTPPFGFTLFYLRGVAPKTISMVQMYKGVVPFIIIQLLALILVVYYPELIAWLPKLIFGTTF